MTLEDILVAKEGEGLAHFKGKNRGARWFAGANLSELTVEMTSNK